MTNEAAGRVSMLRGDAEEPALLVRRLANTGDAVLYVHGATFPSSLSVGYRFADRSWMDDLAAAGFDIWAFDFAGFGGSDRPREMDDDAHGPPIGCAPDAARGVAAKWGSPLPLDRLVRDTRRQRQRHPVGGHHDRVRDVNHAGGEIGD